MNIKLLVSLMLGALPLTMMAQDDDMYFVPTKKSTPRVVTARPAPTFYSGSSRSVDEYNRRGGSYYQVVPSDSVGSDIIAFDGQKGVYPDSTMMADDYALTRQMSRWDDYEPDAYAEGYRDGRRDSWSWHSPWFYSSYYPWYDSYWYWNDPWYYGHYGWYDPWYYGWYDPWYYGYYGPWYHSYWNGYYPYYGGGVAYHSGPAGTEHHGRINYNGPRGFSNGHSTTYSAGTFGGRSVGSGVRSGNFGGSRSTASRSTTSSSRPASSGRITNSYGNFGGSRSSSSSTYSNSSSASRSYTPSYSSSSSSSSSSGSFGGGGSFGGSRSSGGGGGGRSGGGGFGGRR